MYSYLFSIGINSKSSGPVYSALGRIILLLILCSITCADQPVVLAITNIGVKKDVGIPIILYATAENLLTITKYTGIDPEINQGGVAPGVDNNNFYPKTRVFMFGLNVSF